MRRQEPPTGITQPVGPASRRHRASKTPRKEWGSHSSIQHPVHSVAPSSDARYSMTIVDLFVLGSAISVKRVNLGYPKGQVGQCGCQSNVQHAKLRARIEVHRSHQQHQYPSALLKVRKTIRNRSHQIETEIAMEGVSHIHRFTNKKAGWPMTCSDHF